MKIKLTPGKFFTLAFCVMAIVGAAGVMQWLFSKSLYSGLCDIGIIVMNIGLILATLFGAGRFLKNILFFLDFAAFVAILYFTDTTNEVGSTYFVLLMFGGFLAWLSYVGIVYFLLLLGVPFKILGCLMDKKKRANGIFGGTTWVCKNCIETPDGHIHYCNDKTVTFKNGTPSYIDGCIFSENGKHHYVQAGAGSDINSQIGHALGWLGFGLGILAGAGALVANFLKG